MTLFIGCDPGTNGGLACLAGDEVWAVSMPDSAEGVWRWFAAWKDVEAVALIEQVTGHVGGGAVCPLCKQARNRSPGSSMFNFGTGFGRLEMAAEASGVNWNLIHPKTWQKMVGLKKEKAEPDTTWKNRLKERAAALFPSLKVTLAKADALLIAWCCRELNG